MKKLPTLSIVNNKLRISSFLATSFLGISFFVGSFLIPSWTSIASAAQKKSPYAPTALCKDGTYSYSQTHRGTCSHHKGVRKWLK